jgi:hypothetical protein
MGKVVSQSGNGNKSNTLGAVVSHPGTVIEAVALKKYFLGVVEVGKK